MNNVVLIGRLIRDPELRYLPNGGAAYCKFSLAVDKQLAKEKKKELESKGQPTADFVNILAWGKQGENCANYLKKGRSVAIQGRLQSGSYIASDGGKRYTTDVVVEKVQFIDWGNKTEIGETTPQNMGGFEVDDTIGDEDVPF